MRRARAHVALMVALSMLGATAVARADCPPWPAWEAFRNAFISADGRVVDPMHEDRRTVSEGQAYAMLFALVANDRASFDRLLRWTTDNLARADLTRNLPAWLWGRHEDRASGWGVLDSNAASDADIWLAYALLEAGRLWSESRYLELAGSLIRNIGEREVMDLPRLGPTLMPAPHGFAHEGYYRLNPSYLALQPLRRFAQHTHDTLWTAVLASSRRILLEAAPLGIAGDWVEWHPLRGFLPDRRTQGTGSYDAVRVYLWIGMLDIGDRDREELLRRHAPVIALFSPAGRPPEHVEITSGRTRGSGSGGFSAAFLPFLAARGDFSVLAQQKLHLAARIAIDSTRYYDQVLRLWGEGWDAGRYRFAADGSLIAAWTRCALP